MATILIIEDEEVLVRTLAMALSQRGYQTVSALTAANGLRQAKVQKPDLILLDVLLPDSSGIVLLQQLKADSETSAIPVVVLTNLDDAMTVQQILTAGGRAYLVKTDWSIDQLMDKIEGYLAEAKKN